MREVLCRLLNPLGWKIKVGSRNGNLTMSDNSASPTSFLPFPDAYPAAACLVTRKDIEVLLVGSEDSGFGDEVFVLRPSVNYVE